MTALAATVVAVTATAAVAATAATITPAHASVSRAGGLPVGPIQISPLGHPRLCWEAWGNGSPVTLERCDTALQGQQWTFTGNGILMNGNGYCLQHGGAGSTPTGSVYLSFSGQCAGSASQDWTFTGTANSIENPPAHLCASVPGTPLTAGATLTAHPCSHTGTWSTWSQGVSDLTLSAAKPKPGSQPTAATPPGSGTRQATPPGSRTRHATPPGSRTRHSATAHGSMPDGATSHGARQQTGARRAFTANVTVSNAPKAMTAYAASVVLRLPPGLTATKMTGTGALSNWACSVHTLTCRGDLPGSSTGSITVTGSVSTRSGGAGPEEQPVTARATVAGTNQAPHARLTATVPVRTYSLASAGPAAASGGHSIPSGSITTFAVIVAILLLTGGVFLVLTGRRRQQQEQSPAR